MHYSMYNKKAKMNYLYSLDYSELLDIAEGYGILPSHCFLYGEIVKKMYQELPPEFWYSAKIPIHDDELEHQRKYTFSRWK